MNFTREPIIETVITPREGCKLVVRSSKGTTQEDYFVDAVEVVSFGHSFFFRSLERPKSFLVPVSDYEILELKETRMVLKNASTERSIKIGGGREAPPRPRDSGEMREEPMSADRGGRSQDRQMDRQMDRPPMERKGPRRRGRRGRDRGGPAESLPPEEIREPSPIPEEEIPYETAELPPEAMTESNAPVAEPGKTPSFISKLFPPPPTLIKETLSRYKPAEPADDELFPAASEDDEVISFEEKTTFEESIFEHPVPPENQGETDIQENSEE